jgi:hypothetical protein
MILRVQELSGKNSQVAGRWHGRRFTFRVKPWEIKTLRLTLLAKGLKTEVINAVEQRTTGDRPAGRRSSRANHGSPK